MTNSNHHPGPTPIIAHDAGNDVKDARHDRPSRLAACRLSFVTVPAFTLLEVVISMGITTVLLVGITRVLTTSVSYSRNVISLVRFQQEQQRLTLATQNAFLDAEKVVFPTPSAAPIAGKIILRNKTGSAALPFTVIEPTGDNRLIVRDFTLNPASPSTPASSRTNKNVSTTGKTFTLDTIANRIVLGSNATTPCTTAMNSPCVVFGHKNNTLAYPTTGYAPFISAPFISDIRVDADTNYIDILSPYEKREYRIRVATSGATLSTTFTTPSGEFPYYYVGTTATTPTLNATTTFVPPTPPSRPYNVSAMTYATDLTTTGAASPVRLDEVRFTLTDAKNASITATVAVPVLVPK